MALIFLIYGKARLHKIWMLFNLSIALWGMGVFLASSSTNSQHAFLYWKLGYAAGVFISVFFLHAVNIFCKLKYTNILKFSYFYGMAFVVLNITNINDSFYSGTKLLFNSVYYLQSSSFLYLLFLYFWFYLVILANYQLYKFYKKVSGQKKNQAAYLLFGAILGFVGGSTSFLPMFGINFYPITILTIPFYCIIVTYAIFKHHLMDINIVLQKGLVYSILVAFITIIYLIMVLLFERLLQGVVGYQSLIISILTALTIAIIFIPLKNKIQNFVDRVFFKGTFTQIAREKELLQEEVNRSERLKAVATFASGMAHEIKNPLTSIKTFAEYLPKKKNDAEFLNKFSKIVSGEVNRIDSLVHQLLDFAKPAPLKLQSIDIHSLLDETLGLLSNDFLKHRIKVIKNYNTDEHGLKSTDGHGLNISGNSSQISGNSCLIKADSNQLRQAFLNLFLNAIDAMPDGGTLTVSTNLRSSDSKSAIICVKDTGCGIPEEDLPHIFEPFYSKKEEGTGLGLSIVYNIIKEHNGSIKAKSKLGEGTKFIIELPLR